MTYINIHVEFPHTLWPVLEFKKRKTLLESAQNGASHSQGLTTSVGFINT